MKRVRYIGLAAVLVVVAAALAAPPTMGWKGHGKDVRTKYGLIPPATGSSEPGASGRWTLTYFSDIQVKAKGVEVRCRGLTSGAMYTIVVSVHWQGEWEGGSYLLCRSLAADQGGKLVDQFVVERSDWQPYVDDLWIEDAECTVVLETER